METKKGVYIHTRKNGSVSYRASITYKNKHISLGSYLQSLDAHNAYNEAYAILFEKKYIIPDYCKSNFLTFEKWVVLINYRDNGYYIKNPIYMSKNFFTYYLNEKTEIVFDVDDLFYYSNHKIFKRNGYFFINHYGLQVNILSRYGVKNYAVLGKDYYFKDGNPNNLRYDNLIVINMYHGVEKITKNHKDYYVAKININGYYIVGKYDSDTIAAIAYNKAADYVNENNISSKNFPRNFINELDSKSYMELYKKTKISNKIMRVVES